MRKIFLSNGDFTLISDKDYIFLSGYNWCPDGRGYAMAQVDGKVQRMHQLIAKRMDLDSSKGIDHINRNRLDNQRSNLRIATRSQNQANSVISKNNTSGFKGVSKRKNKWKAQICRDSVYYYYLGTFNTPEEAHNAYCEAAEKYFGEFAGVEP